MVIEIRHNFFYEKRKMRIAIYNLQRQGLKLAVAHSPFASKFQCGPLNSVNLYVIIPIHQDRNLKNIDISIDRF